MSNILWGISAIVIFFIVMVLYNFFKAMKDPDVQIAADLKISIIHYRKYQRLYDEYQDFMLKHGTNSIASERKFIEIFKQIDNPNEWRRYQTYRENLAREKRMQEIYNAHNDGSDDDILI